MYKWKNFKKGSIFGKDTDKSLVLFSDGQS